MRKLCNAARAPSVVDADAGMIVGGGKGAVYGMRINGMPGTLSRSNYDRHLHREGVVCERGPEEASQSRMSSPAVGQIERSGGV